MKKPIVFVTQKIHKEVESFLESFSSPIFNSSTRDLCLSEKLRKARAADAILAFMPDRIDRYFLDQCRNLKIISTALKGYDNFDVSECTNRKIWFTISPDLLTIPTAELVITLLLGITRNILHADKFVRSGKFKYWIPKFYGTGLTDKTFGIIGMGNVGKALAKRLHPFDLKLCYYDINRLFKDDLFVSDINILFF